MRPALHLQSLPPEQRRVWEAFSDCDLSNFVLYGGTALALHYGHRISVDFDFFSNEKVSSEGLYRRVPWLKTHLEYVVQEEVNTFVVLTRAPGYEGQEPVKLSFFGELGLPVLNAPGTAPNGVRVASPQDLLATKLKVLVQRIEYKDYVDIAEILRRSDDPVRELQQGLSNMEAMYPEGNSAISLKTLCWFDGGNLHLLDKATKDLLVKTVSQIKDLRD